MAAGRGGRWYPASAVLAGGVLMVCHLAACSDSGRAGRFDGDAGPPLAIHDSILLQESSSLYIARPFFLTRDRHGEFFLTDAFSDRAVRFDRSGRLLQTFGQQGEGAGEHRNVGIVVVVDDSTVTTFDDARRVLNVYRRRTGDVVRVVRHEGIIRSAVVEGRTVWMGAQNQMRGTAVMAWDAHTDSMRFLVPLPEEYVASRALAGTYTGVLLSVWKDTLLVGVQGVNRLVLATERGQILDTIEIPVHRRRGVPADIVRRFSPQVRPSVAAMFQALSALMGLYRRSDGSFVLVHEDLELHGRLITGRVFVSLLSSDRTRFCVDRELIVSQDGQPVFTFGDDTLFVLQQRLTPSQAVKTYLNAYTVDSTSCEWIPRPGLRASAMQVSESRR